MRAVSTRGRTHTVKRRSGAKSANATSALRSAQSKGFRMPKDPTTGQEDTKFYLIGGGIASLAAAAFLIRDGEILRHFLDGTTLPGGRCQNQFPNVLCKSGLPSLDDPIMCSGLWRLVAMLVLSSSLRDAPGLRDGGSVGPRDGSPPAARTNPRGGGRKGGTLYACESHLRRKGAVSLLE